MKIKSLYIRDYKILHDFRIDFNSNLSIIIGENGSGKSSVIECIAYIFGHLHKYFILKDKTAEFLDGYEIEYSINGNNVYIKSRYINSKTNTFQPTIIIDGQEQKASQLVGHFEKFLPRKVVLSYSGITDRLKELNKHYEDKYIKKIIKHDNPYSLKPLSLPVDNPFIYVKKEYISFIILALFSSNTPEAEEILNKIGIDINGCTTTIIIKKPGWAKKQKHKSSNDYLWGVVGRIAIDFINGLNQHGIKEEQDIEQEKTLNKLKYNFYGSLMVQDFFGSYFNLRPDQVVSFMDTLLCDDLLDSVNITWNKSFTIDNLSEGEKQLILSVGLSLVFNTGNLLFLLDEPDVSLHPKWQQEFVPQLISGLNDESMALVATHSPILIGNLQRSHVHVIKNGEIISNNYMFSYGRDVNSILEDYFNTNERNHEGEELINNFYDAMEIQDYDKAESILKTIENLFGPSDTMTVKANSFYDDVAE